MLKLSIFNMERFLETVNACKGEINMFYRDGKKVNISGNYTIQNELLEQYLKGKNYLRLVLDIPNSKDYMYIVSYYIGDC